MAGGKAPTQPGQRDNRTEAGEAGRRTQQGCRAAEGRCQGKESVWPLRGWRIALGVLGRGYREGCKERRDGVQASRWGGVGESRSGSDGSPRERVRPALSCG